MLSGQFVIKATLCSEFERHDCPGCHVCKSHNEYFWNNDGTCETSHKFTGVTLSLVPMVDGDYGFIPPGRDDRVQSLLKSVEIQINLRRKSGLRPWQEQRCGVVCARMQRHGES